MAKNPDVTWAELFALISAARIPINATCEILDVSRETWRGYRTNEWRMGPATRRRAEAMIAGVRYYIDKAVLPTPDPGKLKEALGKIRARVDELAKGGA